MAEFLMYTKKDCPYCVKAKKLIVSHGDTYKETKVEDLQPDDREDLKKWFARHYKLERVTVPQIYKDSYHDYIGGYDELVIYYEGIKDE